MTLSLCWRAGVNFIFSFSRSIWCQSLLEEYGQQSLKKYPTFFLPVTGLFQFNETTCLLIHSTIDYLGFILCQAVMRQSGVCEVQNKIKFLPWRCFHSSVQDGHLINQENQLKYETVKRATKARYRVLWEHKIENWLNQEHQKIIFEDVTHELIRS